MQDHGGNILEGVLKHANAWRHMAGGAVVRDHPPHGACLDDGRGDVADAHKINTPRTFAVTGINLSNTNRSATGGAKGPVDSVGNLLNRSPCSLLKYFFGTPRGLVSQLSMSRAIRHTQ